MDEVLESWFEEDGGEYAFFDVCAAEAGAPVLEGFWSPFSTLAWIASAGDHAFLAAVQLYEQRVEANDSAEDSFGAWMVCGNKAGMQFGRSFSDAADDLRLKLEANQIPGAVATNARTGELVEIDRSRWTTWSVSYERGGVRFLPGFCDFKWPAEAVQGAFPFAVPAPEAAFRTTRLFGGRRPTAQQQEAFHFFDLAANDKRLCDLTQDALFAAYKEQFTARRLRGEPFGLSRFKEMLVRHRSGERVENGRWTEKTD